MLVVMSSHTTSAAVLPRCSCSSECACGYPCPCGASCKCPPREATTAATTGVTSRPLRAVTGADDVIGATSISMKGATGYCECGENCSCNPCVCLRRKPDGEPFCKCGSDCQCDPCNCPKPAPVPI